MGVDSFVDSRNDGLDFVLICKAHREGLGIHRLTDRFVVHRSRAEFDVAHASFFLSRDNTADHRGEGDILPQSQLVARQTDPFRSSKARL